MLCLMLFFVFFVSFPLFALKKKGWRNATVRCLPGRPRSHGERAAKPRCQRARLHEGKFCAPRSVISFHYFTSDYFRQEPGPSSAASLSARGRQRLPRNIFHPRAGYLAGWSSACCFHLKKTLLRTLFHLLLFSPIEYCLGK